MATPIKSSFPPIEKKPFLLNKQKAEPSPDVMYRKLFSFCWSLILARIFILVACILILQIKPNSRLGGSSGLPHDFQSGFRFVKHPTMN
jgi:hypothetical protein